VSDDDLAFVAPEPTGGSPFSTVSSSASAAAAYSSQALSQGELTDALSTSQQSAQATPAVSPPIESAIDGLALSGDEATGEDQEVH